MIFMKVKRAEPEQKRTRAETKHRRRFDWVRATTPLGVIEGKLLHGSARGDLSIVEEALSKGADVNVVGILGKTALETARKRGHTHIVEFLKKNGAIDRTKEE